MAHDQRVQFMWQSEDHMIVSRGQELGSFKFNPLFFFERPAVGAMPVATTVVLPMLKPARCLIALKAMHAYACRMATVQLIEHRPAVRIK